MDSVSRLHPRARELLLLLDHVEAARDLLKQEGWSSQADDLAAVARFLDHELRRIVGNYAPEIFCRCEGDAA